MQLAKLEKWNAHTQTGTMRLINGQAAFVELKAFKTQVSMLITYSVIVQKTPGKMREIISANLP